MIGIVFATRQEAEPFLIQSAARPLTAGPLPLFRTEGSGRTDSIVAISGMGKVAAALAATHLVLSGQVKLLVNAGLCGCLTRIPRWPVGRVLRISSVVEGDCDRMGRPEPPLTCRCRWFGHLTAARLVTNDRPVFQDDWREALAAEADLADMEGAAVARVADRYGIPWALIKGISDRADSSGRDDIAGRIDAVSRTIATALLRELAIPHNGNDS